MKTKRSEAYERRTVTGTVEVREKDGGGVVIRGLAAVFNKLSDNLGGFREIIKPSAFAETDMVDVRALFNHDSNFVLGRTVADTLSLEVTDRGLEYEVDMPATQTIRDLVLEPIKRGDVSQSSFGFIVARGGDEWDEDENGVIIRTISKFRQLFDVSPVTFPAYPDTTVASRSLEAWRNDQQQAAELLEQRRKRGLIAASRCREAQLSGR